MRQTLLPVLLFALLSGTALAGQAPGPAASPDIPVSARDRFYSSDQFSNTVSVVDPGRQHAAGCDPPRRHHAGEPEPALQAASCSSTAWASRPTRKTLLAVSIGSNSVSFIDTATNAVSTRHLCRPLAARGLLHAGRQGSLGQHSWRGLHRGPRRGDRQGDRADHGAERARHDDLLARWALRLRLLQLSAPRRS